jgi:hypothetical protein
MTRKQILSVVYLSKCEGYILYNGGPQTPSPFDRDSPALDDPAFGWHVVDYFVSRKSALPAGVQILSLRSAFYFSIGDLRDADVQEALMLHKRSQSAAIANALLLCRSMDMATAAKWLDVEEKSLRFYEELFFNVRDRLNEKDYLRRLVYPNGRPAVFTRKFLDEETFAARLLRLAYEDGPRHVVLASGLAPQRRDNMSSDTWAEAFESDTIREAALAARAGYGNTKDMPVLNRATALLESRRKYAQTAAPLYGEEFPGLDGMSAGQAVIDTILQLTSERPRSPG